MAEMLEMLGLFSVLLVKQGCEGWGYVYSVYVCGEEGVSPFPSPEAFAGYGVLMVVDNGMQGGFLHVRIWIWIWICMRF